MKKGLLIVNTGTGKGKTTASLGTLIRAWGHGMNVVMIQFIKNENAHFGEIKAARKIGISWHITGGGFVMPGGDPKEAIEKAEKGWSLAQEIISSGEYDLVVLDEFTYPLNYGWLDTKKVLSWIEENKPESMHLIITGRYAPEELIEMADMVNEVTSIKHPFDKGIKAQIGIEY